MCISLNISYPKLISLHGLLQNILLLAERADMPALRFGRAVTKQSAGLFIIGTAATRETKGRASAGAAGGHAGIHASSPKTIHTVDDLCQPIRALLPHHRRGAAVTLQQRTKAAWSWLIGEHNLGAFSVVGSGVNPVEVYATLCSSAGLGGLTPRTVAIPLGFGNARDISSSMQPRPDLAVLLASQIHFAGSDSEMARHRESEEDSDHSLALGSSASQIELLRRIVDLQMNVLVLRGLSKFARKLDMLKRAGQTATVDVWILESEVDKQFFGSDLSLLVQFGLV